jgi:hypothetical protein
MSMRLSLLAASAVLFLATTAAFAGPQASSSSTAGHSTKLGQCSHANAGKTGADYKAAQAACMKGDTGAAAPAKETQQQKMARCSKANAGKKGADYKTAQAACLKGS